MNCANVVVILFWLLTASTSGIISSDFLLVSERYEIRGLSLANGSAPDVIQPVGGLGAGVAVDFSADTDEIVWSDVVADKLSVVHKNGTNRRTILQSVPYTDGLAVDWVGGIVYFTDKELDVIGVVSLVGDNPRLLVDTGLEEPRSIALDPEGGVMFWTDWGTSPKIESAFMSGKSRKTVISNGIIWPNGLALDLTNKRMYWADAKFDRIESSDFNGLNRKVILDVTTEDVHPFGIALDGSYLYWTDWAKKVIYKTSISQGKYVLFANMDYTPFGLAIYNKGRTGGTNGCSKNNGGCSQLCLPEPTLSFTCACSHGIMQSNNRTCQRPDKYLLLADLDTVRGLTEDSLRDAFPPVTGLTRAIAIDYDAKTDDIYYTDVAHGSIEQLSNGKKTTVTNSLSVPDGVAVDSIGRNVFYTDTTLDVIGVVRMDGSAQLTVISSQLSRPRDIALDLEDGKMYWTDWGDSPKIEKAWIDGTNRQVIVNTTLGWPNGIVLDTKSQILYWADAKVDRVEKCKFDGTGRTLLFQSSQVHPFGLVLDNNYLYWTDWSSRNIVRMPAAGSNAFSVFATPFPRLNQPSGLILHDSRSRLTVRNACSVGNGNCSQFCLPIPSGRRCACSDLSPALCKPKVAISGQSSLIVYQHSAVTLRCSVGGEISTGIPIISYGWRKGALQVRSHYGSSQSDVTSLFTISSASKSDSETYSCWATNKYGTNMSSTLRLSVADISTATSKIPTTPTPTTQQPSTPLVTTHIPTTKQRSSTQKPTFTEEPTTEKPTTSPSSKLPTTVATTDAFYSHGRTSGSLKATATVESRAPSSLPGNREARPTRGKAVTEPMINNKPRPTILTEIREPNNPTEETGGKEGERKSSIGSDRGSNVGLYVGLALLGLVAVIAFSIAVVIWKRRQRSGDVLSSVAVIENQAYLRDSPPLPPPANPAEVVYAEIAEHYYKVPKKPPKADTYAENKLNNGASVSNNVVYDMPCASGQYMCMEAGNPPPRRILPGSKKI
eukprot:m.2638 g.2638  ORF g.2638 m.2638 type:complete len:1003 (+) comp8812_c0_seq1:275-3283(+)